MYKIEGVDKCIFSVFLGAFMPEENLPYLIDFKRIGEEAIGHISVAELEKSVPFDIKRVFWTYGTPETVERGNHSHRTNKEIIIAVSGEITLTAETTDGYKKTFVLNNPNQGLFIPTDTWITMNYSPGTVQLVMNSNEFKEEDYIRSYEEFKKL